MPDPSTGGRVRPMTDAQWEVCAGRDGAGKSQALKITCGTFGPEGIRIALATNIGVVFICDAYTGSVALEYHLSISPKDRFCTFIDWGLQKDCIVVGHSEEKQEGYEFVIFQPEKGSRRELVVSPMTQKGEGAGEEGRGGRGRSEKPFITSLTMPGRGNDSGFQRPLALATFNTGDVFLCDLASGFSAPVLEKGVRRTDIRTAWADDGSLFAVSMKEEEEYVLRLYSREGGEEMGGSMLKTQKSKRVKKEGGEVPISISAWRLAAKTNLGQAVGGLAFCPSGLPWLAVGWRSLDQRARIQIWDVKDLLQRGGVEGREKSSREGRMLGLVHSLVAGEELSIISVMKWWRCNNVHGCGEEEEEKGGPGGEEAKPIIQSDRKEPGDFMRRRESDAESVHTEPGLEAFPPFPDSAMRPAEKDEDLIPRIPSAPPSPQQESREMNAHSSVPTGSAAFASALMTSLPLKDTKFDDKQSNFIIATDKMGKFVMWRFEDSVANEPTQSQKRTGQAAAQYVWSFTGEITSMQSSPSGQWIALGSKLGLVFVGHVDRLSPNREASFKTELKTPGYVASMSFAEDGERLAVATQDGHQRKIAIFPIIEEKEVEAIKVIPGRSSKNTHAQQQIFWMGTETKGSSASFVLSTDAEILVMCVPVGEEKEGESHGGSSGHTGAPAAALTRTLAEALSSAPFLDALKKEGHPLSSDVLFNEICGHVAQQTLRKVAEDWGTSLSSSHQDPSGMSLLHLLVLAFIAQGEKVAEVSPDAVRKVIDQNPLACLWLSTKKSLSDAQEQQEYVSIPCSPLSLALGIPNTVPKDRSDTDFETDEEEWKPQVEIVEYMAEVLEEWAKDNEIPAFFSHPDPLEYMENVQRCCEQLMIHFSERDNLVSLLLHGCVEKVKPGRFVPLVGEKASESRWQSLKDLFLGADRDNLRFAHTEPPFQFLEHVAESLVEKPRWVSSRLLSSGGEKLGCLGGEGGKDGRKTETKNCRGE
uniref:Uncharacterized protein n=1 Tax=Chromera velia CCMP2878 TaxID=1169474 RepID=A0A0K6SAK0_9ALVE|eukprot:Cvel_10612.t1-p1 / transcript=Cvel_10612.t1 / gene=Cvel_10612 / organism=Chromera_velia_CCMP2878 / gene_product=hypothetical protein / transcript_product=hypothetical protein / location=Cvel_scaffold644:28308-32086(-) / protein_length=984 / sequence_SO=supercontig / SO=protein_coding / is_pseudo=false